MDKTTKNALKESVAHWKRMARGKRRELPGFNGKLRLEEANREFCALCHLFYDNGCKGCPVSERTGKDKCQDTPQVEAANAYADFGYDSPEFEEAAQKQVKFLQSLTN